MWKRKLFQSRYEEYENINDLLNNLNHAKGEIARFNFKTREILEIGIKSADEEIKKM